MMMSSVCQEEQHQHHDLHGYLLIKLLIKTLYLSIRASGLLHSRECLPPVFSDTHAENMYGHVALLSELC